MRRRQRDQAPGDQPPPHLLEYDPAEWMPLVDTSEYNPDDWRDRRNWEPVGPVKFSFENWHKDQAWHLWTKARHQWHDEHGWPGGLDFIGLIAEEVRTSRHEIRTRTTNRRISQ